VRDAGVLHRHHGRETEPESRAAERLIEQKSGRFEASNRDRYHDAVIEAGWPVNGQEPVLASAERA
jgi:hypothetical protein